jgi:hypothetical protein
MAKQRTLSTRAFGSEPKEPNVSDLAAWVAEHRGSSGDLATYLLDTSLIPQIAAGIGVPCAGGMFCKDRLTDCLIGVQGGIAVDEVGVYTEPLVEDAIAVTAQKKGVWYALPAPHTLMITDKFYDDEDEWSDAIATTYRTLMRSMRDAGVGGHVLICDHIDDAEIAALARQKVFFFNPEPDRESIATMMEYQRQIVVGKDLIETVFDLANEYELHQIIILDADAAAIATALSHLDPDQVMIGGYYRESCDDYWKDLVVSAVYNM